MPPTSSRNTGTPPEVWTKTGSSKVTLAVMTSPCASLPFCIPAAPVSATAITDVGVVSTVTVCTLPAPPVLPARSVIRALKR